MTCSRITIDPAQMNGVPCIRGLRIPVAAVVNRVADGLQAASDLEIFDRAAQEDRVLVSADTDFGSAAGAERTVGHSVSQNLTAPPRTTGRATACQSARH